MFGYVDGGYKSILDRFAHHLNATGVRILTGFKVRSIKSLNMEVVVENQDGEESSFDEMIVTTPSHIASSICYDLSEAEKEKQQQIEYLGVICASVLLKKSLSPFYVTNITDKTPFTGIIEMTNLVDRDQFNGHHLIYLPRYLKKNDPMFHKTDTEIKDHFWKHLLNMYDHLSDDDLVAFQVARNPYVFALSTLGYSDKLPEISTSLSGVHILNSAHIMNGTLNVNETLQVVDRELPHILKTAQSRKILAEFL
jgi:protoporphyrinogen oxidase